MEKLAKDARFGLLVGHTLTPGSIAGVLVVLGEALKCRHEAGALDNNHQYAGSVGVRVNGMRRTRRRVPWFAGGVGFCSGLFILAEDEDFNCQD